MGGGLELALACHYRIATDDRQTTLGLPEVKLGIHPGFGGSVRAVRLLGPIRGLSFVLEGRSVDAIAAKRMGLVDEVVPLRELRRAAIYYIQHKPKVRKPSLISKLLEISFIRPLLGSLVKKKLAAKVKIEQYPAPYTVVDN